jgi:anaerobic selenocysteine-containing dehydrogenase
MCACRCGIRVHLRDGVVRYIDGNPDHPLNKGVICAKGSSGIMKQYSPARLLKPLKRKAGAERGAGEFEEIEWDEAFATLAERLGKIRATDPKKFALFTGRDQMQALTGMFARQFGTPNYAAHGGFCSVNMAAGMIYTIGGSFWEFGGPDLDRAKLFVMIGTAEDHHSNPLKIALSKFKRDGGRFISINPVRTGYSAIADEWVPIRPGTDGALLLAIIHEIIATGLYDREFLVQYSNAGQLINVDEANDEFGFFVRTEVPTEEACYEPQDKLWWDRTTDRAVVTHSPGADPFLLGEFKLPDGTPVKPAFQLLQERVKEYTPEWAAQITGIPAETIRRVAHEMGVTARDQKIELPIAWTDSWGREHDTVTGNPVAFHAMRGLAAHSNGFQTIRAMSILMSLLGTIDRPGGFRHKAPFPRPIPPCARTPNDPRAVQPNRPLDGMALGWPSDPDDLFVNDDGSPVRIDKAFSWEYPLSVHGLMHNAITNAWRGDPYRIDTLLIFMANMAWNSTMNAVEVRKMLNDKAEDGEYKIPFLVVCDAFHSEMTAFADLILPDTTYLERHDVMSMLDRPISEFDGPVDSVRVPVVPGVGRLQAFPGGADRTRHAPQAAGLRHEGRRAQVPRLSRLCGELGIRARLRHRLPRRLEREGRREIAARRTEPEPVGDVQEEQLRLPLRTAEVLPVHAQLEQGLPRMVAAQPHHALCRADPHSHLFRGAATLPCRRTGQGLLAPAAGSAEEARRDLFRPAAFLLRSARSPGHRQAPVSSGGRDAATDGDVPLLGFAERLAAPDPYPQLPLRQCADRPASGHR